MTHTGWAFVVGAALTFSGCYDFESPLDAVPQLQETKLAGPMALSFG